MAVIKISKKQMDIMLYLLELEQENKSFKEAINKLESINEIPLFSAAAVELGLRFYIKEFDLLIYGYDLIKDENKIMLIAKGLSDFFTIEEFKEIVELKRPKKEDLNNHKEV